MALDEQASNLIIEWLSEQNIPFSLDTSRFPMHHSDNYPFSIRIARTREPFRETILPSAIRALRNLFAAELSESPSDRKADRALAREQFSSALGVATIGAVALGGLAYGLYTFSTKDWTGSMLGLTLPLVVFHVFGTLFTQAAHLAFAERMSLRL